MEKYSGLIIWIVIAAIAIFVVRRIFKKIKSLIITLAILILSGTIPYSTITSTIENAKHVKETISTQQAALWRCEENQDTGSKTIYILNSIPVTIK